MNAERWNELHPVGTLVFAYPGCRPEDGADTRLVTRTRTKAQVSASGDPVVWVDGEGSYICLTHVDPVSESAWKAAKEKEADACGAREPEPRTGTSPCVLPAGHGGLKHQDKWTNQRPALPVPVGDQPQPLNDTRVAEALAAYVGHPDLGFACCSAHAVADHAPALLADNARLRSRVAELEAELTKYVGKEPTIAEEMAYLSRCLDAVEGLHLPKSLKVDSISRDYRNGYVHALADMRAALELAPTGRAEEA